jgi:hypothetical protein
MIRYVVILGTILFSSVLAFAPPASAQKPGLEVPLVTPGPGWKPCPRCENDAHIAEDRKKVNVDTRQFDHHDLSGIWGNYGMPVDPKTRPPFTPYGEKLNEDLKKKETNRFGANDLVNDPLGICDPLGYPRAMGYNYGFEFFQAPDRVFQFFELSHTWRTIWTDGRKLPSDPPIDRFMGYAVGHWEGDTFVVESSGYDDRTLLGGDGAHPLFAHSSEMRLVEHYKRLDYGMLEVEMTLVDPKILTAPWTTTGKIELHPAAEIGEDYCVPSDSISFNNRNTVPAY